MSEEYKVGYGKPPLHSRFKKGEPSPNPAGRRKRSRLTLADIDEAFDRALAARVPVAENGKVRTMRKLDALATQTVNKGLKGHHPTSSMILSHYQKRAAAAPADEYEAGRTSEESIAEIDAMLNEIAGNLSADVETSVPQSHRATEADRANETPDSASATEASRTAIDAS